MAASINTSITIQAKMQQKPRLRWRQSAHSAWPIFSSVRWPDFQRATFQGIAIPGLKILSEVFPKTDEFNDLDDEFFAYPDNIAALIVKFED